MNYKDRNGTLIVNETDQDRLLRNMYNTVAGRMLVRILITRPVTAVCGAFLRTRVSALFIKKFIRKSNIDMSIYENRKFKSYNDFFTRRIKEGARPVDGDPYALISPCDAKASAFKIDDSTSFYIKGTQYTTESLLKDKKLAAEYKGGICVLLRLCVDDYHRYCYVSDGSKGENISIRGVLHTVNPAAVERAPVYKENSREYTTIETEYFGKMIQMEVGALIVGKIVNYDKKACAVERGSEKGRFEFGGSTIILLFTAGKVEISPDILANTGDDIETIVKMGEKIGMSQMKSCSSISE